MQITKVQIKRYKGTNGLVGYASILIDDAFIVNSIKVFETKSKRYVMMPINPVKSKKGEDKRDKYAIAYPVNQETRDLIEAKIFEELDKTSDAEHVEAAE